MKQIGAALTGMALGASDLNASVAGGPQQRIKKPAEALRGFGSLLIGFSGALFSYADRPGRGNLSSTTAVLFPDGILSRKRLAG